MSSILKAVTLFALSITTLKTFALTTINVTTTLDKFENLTYAKLNCITNKSNCSLREAIAYANSLPANSGSITIQLEAKTYYISKYDTGLGDKNYSGDFNIYPKNPLTIVGLGERKTTIDGMDNYRVINHTAGDLTIKNLRIAHGKVNGFLKDDKFQTVGAGILSLGLTNRLSLSYVTLNSNRYNIKDCGVYPTASGGVGHTLYYYSPNPLTLKSVRIFDTKISCNDNLNPNITLDGTGIAIYATSKQITMQDSYINYDIANAPKKLIDSGPGVALICYIDGFYEVDCAHTVKNTTIFVASDNGARNTNLFISDQKHVNLNEGLIDIDESNFKNINITLDRVYSKKGSTEIFINPLLNAHLFKATATITRSQFEQSLGYGLFIYSPAGYDNPLNEFGGSIAHSTVTNNAKGISITGGKWYLINNTISGNSGSGLSIKSFTNHNQADVLLNYNTIAFNGNINDPDLTNGGANIYLGDYAKLTAVNTIISNPLGKSCNTSLNSSGYNLDHDGSCGLKATTDIVGKNPALLPLADNGGYNKTHALGYGSPAIDKGNFSLGGTYYDQRYVLRSNGKADIGAFEREEFNIPCLPDICDPGQN